MNRCFFGHNIDALQQLAAKGVRAQTCVTSPPYWGLRDYGIPPVHWSAMEYVPMAGLPPVSVPAWDGCLGLEPDPLMFVGHIVAVFRAVRDVLADDGTAWVNMGDCYATGAGKVGKHPGGGEQGSKWAGRHPTRGDRHRALRDGRNAGKHTAISAMGPMTQPNRLPQDGLKPKDLMMMPSRVALALQADGWYLRSDIIWAKPNPMPESVTDRPTKAHEYIFLLAKSERYYYDADAIKEQIAESSIQRINQSTFDQQTGGDKDYAKTGQNANRSMRKTLENFKTNNVSLRNKRTVWTVGTKPYSGAHFATFPPELIEPCILAGSKPGQIVLDIFFGSGTTGAVSERLGRGWIGCEIGAQYEPLQRERTRQIGMAI